MSAIIQFLKSAIKGDIKPIVVKYESPKMDLEEVWQEYLAKDMQRRGCYGLAAWLRDTK